MRLPEYSYFGTCYMLRFNIIILYYFYSFSSYSFETNMGFIKSLIKMGKLHISQLVNRLEEKQQINDRLLNMENSSSNDIDNSISNATRIDLSKPITRKIDIADHNLPILYAYGNNYMLFGKIYIESKNFTLINDHVNCFFFIK